MKEFFSTLFQLLLHPGEEKHWATMIALIGATNLYIVMFAIIFAETGLVIAPFLPGDSLLFAVGAIGTRNIGLNWQLAAGLLMLAAITGDNVNYWVGRKFGPSIFAKEVDALAHGQKPSLFARLLNKKHLEKTEKFFHKHGGKAVVLGRFIVVVRTCMPFVAGMGKMNYARFLSFSVMGAFLWIGVCVGAGVWLGQWDWVKAHFEIVILAIIGVTVVPAGLKILAALIQKSKQGGEAKKTIQPAEAETTV